MHIIIDLVTIILCIVCVYTCYKNGFIKTFLSLSTYILAALLANYISKSVASSLYTNYIRPNVVKGITGQFQNVIEDTNVQSALDRFYDLLPFDLEQKIMSIIGPKDSVLSSVTNNGISAIQNISEVLTDNIFGTISQTIIQLLIFLLLFFLIKIIVNMLSYFITGLVNMMFLGKVNKLLGGLLGIGYSAIQMLIISVIVYIIITITLDQLNYFNTDIIEKTTIFKIFYKFNPFLL